MLIGKMRVGSTFGEISLIEDSWITCSIVTATPVKLAVITFERLTGNILNMSPLNPHQQSYLFDLTFAKFSDFCQNIFSRSLIIQVKGHFKMIFRVELLYQNFPKQYRSSDENLKLSTQMWQNEIYTGLLKQKRSLFLIILGNVKP